METTFPVVSLGIPLNNSECSEVPKGTRGVAKYTTGNMLEVVFPARQSWIMALFRIKPRIYPVVVVSVEDLTGQRLLREE